MKKYVLMFVLMSVFSSYGETMETKFDKVMDDYLRKFEKNQSELKSDNLRKINSVLANSTSPTAYIEEHTGLFRWMLLSECFYDYDMDTTGNVEDINVGYQAIEDNFVVIPANFNIWTSRPYSSLELYKNLRISAMQSSGSNLVVLEDEPDSSYGFPGHSYIQSFEYSGTEMVTSCKFLKVDDICCCAFYITSKSAYDISIYKLLFDLILASADFESSSNSSEFGTLKKSTSLKQNFPNPFNPATTIEYSLNEPGLVKLEIFNINGQLVSRLIDGFQTAGNHSIIWDGTGDNGRASSGVYFYKLSTDDFVENKSMLLLR